jgi:NAD(P)-dependent dehydrogenase (short-subunit alcohol dehydrogenase family)
MSDADSIVMKGKTIAITGANSGIGRATARALAAAGATVLACGRDPVKIEAACAEIRQDIGNDAVHPLVADLSELEQVRRLASAIQERTDRLDVLINNAGLATDHRVETVDGLELTFAVNHMAPFVLTNALLPLLKASAPARVVNVSSALYASVKSLDLDDLQLASGSFGWQKAYNQSKLANILFTRELSRRLDGTGVTVNALHPGVIDTGFGADGDLNGLNAFTFRVMKWFLPGPAKGARTSVHLACSPEVEGVTGHYFEDCREKALSGLASDDELARELWRRSEGLAATTM